jgi:hypothetical protein
MGVTIGTIGVLLAVSPALAAGEGTILSLSGIGASQPGDPITINASVQAIESISQSNLSYLILSPRGAPVAVHVTEANDLEPGEVFNDTWSTSNTPDTGTYTVALCWSMGNSRNCRIDLAITQFYSVPTLGVGLTAAGAGLIALWIWRNRRSFALAEVR